LSKLKIGHIVEKVQISAYRFRGVGHAARPILPGFKLN
jgi:hypothetical protein